MSYSIPNQTIEITYEVKKSLFHARAGYASSRTEAMNILGNCKADYPDARHHCWAYLFGSPSSPISAAMNDDGEPSGTAGKPILNVLQHKDIGNIMLVVSRYFGGIKLGAGGLVRAYSNSAQQVIESLAVTPYIEMCNLKVQVQFKNEQFVRHLIDLNGGEIADVSYANGVQISFSIPKAQLEPITDRLSQAGIVLQHTKPV